MDFEQVLRAERSRDCWCAEEGNVEWAVTRGRSPRQMGIDSILSRVGVNRRKRLMVMILIKGCRFVK